MNALCNGLNGTASVSGTSGGTAPYTYTWTLTSDPSSQIRTSSSSASLAAGSYTLVVSDNRQCTKTYTGGQITQPSMIMHLVLSVLP